VNTKKIYVIRHGETEYNRIGKVQGSGIDSSLNDKGFRQAKAFYDAYKDVPFEKIYCSRLQRTLQSVHAFIEDSVPYEQLTELNEISWGDQEGQLFHPSIHDEYRDLLEAWQNGDITRSIGGGEAPIDVMNRQKKAMDYIMSKEDEKLILMSIHGRALRILLTWLTGNHLKDMEHLFVHKNLCVYSLLYDGTAYTVDLHCNLEHLEGIEI